MRWLFALLLLTGSVFAQSQQPPQKQDAPSDNSKQQSDSTQRGTDQIPFVVKVAPAPKTQAETNKEEQEKAGRAHIDAEKSVIDAKIAFETQRIADYTDRLTNFTLGLIIVACLQAILFGIQLVFMRGEINRAKEIFIAEHRPWISIEKTILESPIKFVQGGMGLNIKIFIKNVGNSPAKKIALHAELFTLRTGKIPFEETYKMFMGNSITLAHESGSAIIFPGQETSGEKGLSILRGELETSSYAMRSGDRIINCYVHVAVTYHFPAGNSPHQTGLTYLLPPIVIPDEMGETAIVEQELNFAPMISGSAT